MLPQSLTWIDAEFVQKVLKFSENDDSIKVKDVSMRLATATGDNYLSHMIRATVEYSRDNSCGKVAEKKSIIIKVAPTTGVSKNFVTDNGVFDTEIKMMENTLVKMNAMLDEKENRLSARVLWTKIGDPSLLVIEDLAPLGFRMSDRHTGLDLQHCIFAIRGLARFHATSVALWEKEPRTMDTYNRHAFQKATEDFPDVFGKTFRTVANEMLDWSELGSSQDSYAKKFIEMSQNYSERFTACTTPNAEEFNVLNHGDCWTNNMLFRHDSEGKVTGHIFVDFQLSIRCTPAVDILYFTNTSITEEVELHHLDTLLEEYLNVLTETLSTLHCHTKAPDMESLKKYLEKYQFLAVTSSCIALPFMFIDKIDAKSIDEMTDDGYVNPGFKALEYRKRMLRRLPVWNAAGVLDS